MSQKTKPKGLNTIAEISEAAKQYCPFQCEALRELWGYGFEDRLNGKPMPVYAPYFEVMALHHGWITADAMKAQSLETARASNLKAVEERYREEC